MAEATVSDKYAQVRGFRVEISGSGGAEVDTAWETLESGRTTTPGHKYVDTLTLRGAMTNGRKALCEWVDASADGRRWRRDVTITVDYEDGTPPVAINFEDCFCIYYGVSGLDGADPKNPKAGAAPVEELRFAYRRWTEVPVAVAPARTLMETT